MFDRRISRRDSVKQLAAAGILGAAATALPNRRSFAQTPKKGGSLRVGCGDSSTTDSLVPTVSGNSFTWIMMGQVYNGLTEIDADNNVIPDLAESWEPSADVATWHFKIRKGVEFHNGRTVIPEDVAASINRHRGKDSKSAVRSIANQMADVKVDGENVAITLNSPNADFPYALCDLHFAVIPQDTQDADLGKGLGTGPYILQEFSPGVRAYTKRNPNYWKSNRGHVDEVETLAINDMQARITALISGRVDVINRCDPKLVSVISERPDLEVADIPGDLFYSTAMLADVDPFTNNELRMALKYAIDREALLKNLLQGHGTLGNDHPISQRNQFFAKDLPQRAYDPDKAKFHLKKAGYDSVSLTLSTSPGVFTGAIDFASYFQVSARKTGINIEIERVPDDGYWKNIWRNKPWCATYWSGRPTADGILSFVFQSKSASNESGWKSPELDGLLKQARGELDQAKRRDIYFECQRLINEEACSIISLFPNHIIASSNKLQHDKVAGDREMDGARLVERWWFA